MRLNGCRTHVRLLGFSGILEGNEIPKCPRTAGTVGGVAHENGSLTMHDYSISPSGKIRYIEVDHGYDTPCWDWQMHRNEKGYGRLRLNGKNNPAHRLYYERYRGEIPDGYQIDHLCRNRSCVNPDHLEAVTAAENVRRSKSTPFTHKQVEDIRRLKGVDACKEVARKYGVAHSTISRIWSGKRWAEDGNDVVVNARKRAKYDIGCDMARSESRQNPRQIRDSAYPRYRVQDSAGCANTDK